MSQIGVCILAIGEEHIDEALNLIRSMRDNISYRFHFYIGTDDVNKFKYEDVSLISITEDFNYNFKKIPIEAALNECDTVIFLDSDHVAVSDCDFVNLENSKDGFYGMIYKDFNHSDYPKYYNFLKGFNENIPYIFEHIFIIKLKDHEMRRKFSENWNRIYNLTREFQPSSKSRIGSNEGLIIGLSCLMSDIEIIDPVINSEMFQYFLPFHHYCDEVGKRKYLNHV